ncbi:basic leucine zipper 19-like isoform X2 [Zingiber officinale]|uniref:basic leucine zipper 19-like isoform X2 n=1 Tax=Zingiber officinale TaxID=94328 RepID=UPI001C4CFCD9|nr:basic leucine zipper 19-like isoform X2 [Zingiber officinale]
MDERETDFCASKDLSDEVVPSICSMGSFFDDLLNDGHHHQCTHTHTCNPPGPDLAHTHTCFHIHTKVLSADETAESAEKRSSAKRRPGGNREAVRKYREKKKAHAASLEDEIAHLRAINQQLIKRLQGQAALEAEIARMKCLLVDLRGRIEGEIGSFPYQKPVKGSGDFVPNIITRSRTQSRNVGETGVRNVGNVQCRGSSNSGTDDFADCGGNGTARTLDCSSNAALTRIEGAHGTEDL